MHFEFSIFRKNESMSEKKIVILITAGLIFLTAVFFYTVRDEAEEYRSSISKEVVVEQTWKLPKELKEVSAIAFLKEDLLACIQDEDGIIFLFDLHTSKVVKKIPFGKGGDYEGIAVHQNIIFVLQANGTIYRINNIDGKPKVESFETPFSSKNDMEGMFFDVSRNRLLVSVKERDLHSKDYKGIYAIDPETMELEEAAVYKMSFKEEMFRPKNRKTEGSFFPSEINRNSKTGEILVLEAREPKLLILDPNGKPKALHRLDRKFFPQPEGLAFDNNGNLYISTEGDPGMIHRVNLKTK